MDQALVNSNVNNRINPQKFALWVGMASIIMMFGAFTSAYIVKQAAGGWLEFTLPYHFYISSSLIVLSSITLHLSYKSYLRANESLYKKYLVATLILGLSFLILQTMGWTDLFSRGIDFRANVSGSFFYLITGIHAVHVMAGIAALIIACMHAFTLKFGKTEKRINRFQLTTNYWHFMGALWIYLFLFLTIVK